MKHIPSSSHFSSGFSLNFISLISGKMKVRQQFQKQKERENTETIGKRNTKKSLVISVMRKEEGVVAGPRVSPNTPPSLLVSLKLLKVLLSKVLGPW